MAERVVAITGAFGVLGSAVVQAANAAGWTAVGIDYAPPPEALAEDPRAFGRIDLTDPKAAQQVMDTIVERFGALHALVNCAGGFKWTTLADSSVDDWTGLYRMNVVTTSNACRAASAALAASGSGRIVNIGAGAAERAANGMGAYAASKAGVHRLTEALAEELKGKVTVNAVLPSIIDTPTNRADMPKADFSTWISPSELAAMIVFLASEAASGVTGALIRTPGRV